MSAFVDNFLRVLLDSAPWLLLGMIISGILKAWIPQEKLSRWFGKPGAGSVIKAALAGAPLPLCSCGVLPVALGLRRGGGSKGATVSFLIATPETGVDSIAISYALLGPVMAVVRPIAALISAIVAGLLVLFTERFDKEIAPPAAAKRMSIPIASGSGGVGPAIPVTPPTKTVSATIPITPPSGTIPIASVSPIVPIGVASVEKPADSDGCGCGCGDSDAETADAAKEPGFVSKTLTGLHYSFTNILDDIMPWLIVGLVGAALVATLVPSEALAEYGSGPMAMIVMALIGVPMYICATASTPLAAAMLHVGVSPGAILVFLLAGPATNIGTLGVVRKELGSRALIAYLVGIVGGAILLGLAMDPLLQLMGWEVTPAENIMEHAVGVWIAWVSTFILIFMAIPPCRRLIGIK
ncbi:MAG: SO_0444 family Cu/Zn efflux transporter [Magnetococcales bacterium]|nr:SO_0444 family Cu/Zn efflux transporter [Magnetococcales bacterium]